MRDASFEQTILEFIETHHIRCERRKFSSLVATSEAAAREAGLTMEQGVKTILFQDGELHLYAVILRCSRRVDVDALSAYMGGKKLTLVGRDMVETWIGYPAGGVPPFGFDATFFMDEDLQDEELVSAGGGTVDSLLFLRVDEIKKVVRPITLQVSQ